jgi:hypothetical protein
MESYIMTQQVARGKVRLIAKNGRSSETAYTTHLRQLQTDNNTSMYRTAERKELINHIIGNYFLYGPELEDYAVEFDATPEVTESGNVDYYEFSQLRGPGSVLMYMGSPSRNFTINAKLISRDVTEATKTFADIHKLKSWRQPESYDGAVFSGTPALLYLQGYGKMFKDIPVVMTDLSIEFGSEHDYISLGSSIVSYFEKGNATVLDKFGEVDATKTAYRNKNTTEANKLTKPSTTEFEATAVPIITTVSITLKEARAVEADVSGLEGFDILKYRNGELMSW